MNEFNIDLLSLADYLPEFPSINVLKDDDLFSFYSDRVPTSVSREYYPVNAMKKEYDLPLPAVEKLPIIPGPLISQKFLTRFMSPLTTNEKIIAFHSVGTGKSCLAAFVSDNAKKVDPKRLPSLILTRGEILMRNFQNEIANVCLPQKYKVDKKTIDPLTKRPLTDTQIQIRTNKNLAADFEFNTFYRQAVELSNNSENNYYR
jgi:hypothetical protein